MNDKQMELKGLVKANPIISGPDIYLGQPSPKDGYRPVVRVRNGKRERLGHVGNAAGLRWLLAMQSMKGK